MANFNPNSSSLFNTAFFVPDEADYQFKLGTPKLVKRKSNKTGNDFFQIDIPARIQKGNAEHNNKLVTIGCYLGAVDPATGEFTTDDEGNPKCDFGMVARVFHAAYGYGTTKVEDERWAVEQDGLDLDMDLVEVKLTGSAWDDLKDNEIRATITHRHGDKPGQIYPQFSAIRPLSGG
jgi:hypothetical protein